MTQRLAEETVALSVRVPAQMADAVSELAYQRRMTVSQLLRAALSQVLAGDLAPRPPFDERRVLACLDQAVDALGEVRDEVRKVR